MDFKKEHFKALVLAGLTGAIAVACSGCMSGPFIYEGGYGYSVPVPAQPMYIPAPANPIYVPQPAGYGY